MTLDGFGDLACGSNGGPPRQKLEDWSEFRKCRAEDNGLHEVYARFDDEDEYIGKAIEEPRYARGKTGTRVAGHPVILSVLFDRDGVLRVLRFVTDPRAPSHERRMAHLLRLAVINRYEPDGWTCTDFPPAEGETPRRRRLHQAALRKDDARAPPGGGDALSAQTRPERQRSRDRRIPCGRIRELDALRDPRSQLSLTEACEWRGRVALLASAIRDARYRPADCRGNGMNPSRFGIFTFGSDWASSASSAPITPLS